MRPAYVLAETASKFQSQIELSKDDVRADGKSVLDILTLGAAQGTVILLTAEGEDADEAVKVLEQLVVAGFPTPEKPEDVSGT